MGRWSKSVGRSKRLRPPPPLEKLLISTLSELGPAKNRYVRQSVEHNLTKFLLQVPPLGRDFGGRPKLFSRERPGLLRQPPWTIIANWLHRLLKNPQVTCLMVTPFWDSCAWMPLLRRLLVPGAPQIRVKGYHGMFNNCLNVSMPKPKWDLLCVVLSGKFYRANKFRMRPSILTWDESPH